MYTGYVEELRKTTNNLPEKPAAVKVFGLKT
jgi:hypothetical protein